MKTVRARARKSHEGVGGGEGRGGEGLHRRVGDRPRIQWIIVISNSIIGSRVIRIARFPVPAGVRCIVFARAAFSPEEMIDSVLFGLTIYLDDESLLRERDPARV